MLMQRDSWLANAARSTGVQLVDCGAERGHSLLLASGSGLMMAILDVVPEFRYCAELDRGGHGLDFALLVHRHVRAIGLAGWFSLTSPATFQAIEAAELHCPVLAYYGHLPLGTRTLDRFLLRALLLDTHPVPSPPATKELDWHHDVAG